MVKLAIDAMGGDFAPEEIIKGVNLSIEEHKDLELILYGDEEQIKKYLVPNKRVTIVHTPRVISMGEADPRREIRNNKDTSLVQAFTAVKENQAEGVVTAGPTQAVVVSAHIVLRRMKGMSRMALCLGLPDLGDGKQRLLLDSGANLELKPEHLVQLAEYATIYMKEVMGVEKPVVGLLNIGTEEAKGREFDIEAFHLLKDNKNITFFGNIEPKEMLASPCDILVTDGYTGNMVMKTAEGVAIAVGKLLKQGIMASSKAKFGYLFMKGVFKELKNKTTADSIGGAILIGAEGIVIKAHGSSNGPSFQAAISLARRAVLGNVNEKMKAIIGDKDE